MMGMDISHEIDITLGGKESIVVEVVQAGWNCSQMMFRGLLGDGRQVLSSIGVDFSIEGIDPLLE